jgi:hypothetical protein
MLALTRAVSQAALGDFPAALQIALDVRSGRIPSTEQQRSQATEMAASFEANKLWVTAP